MNTYETRDINYPRTWSTGLNFKNEYIYCFGGYNPNYGETYVNKIEKYNVGANDWITIKFSTSENIKYLPTIKSAVFLAGEKEIIILGGQRYNKKERGYYVFDTKKKFFSAKNDKKIVE